MNILISCKFYAYHNLLQNDDFCSYAKLLYALSRLVSKGTVKKIPSKLAEIGKDKHDYDKIMK